MTRALRRHPPDFPKLATPNPASPEPAKSNNNHTELESCPPADIYAAARFRLPHSRYRRKDPRKQGQRSTPKRNALQISSCRYWPCPSNAPAATEKMPRSRKRSVAGTSMERRPNKSDRILQLSASAGPPTRNQAAGNGATARKGSPQNQRWQYAAVSGSFFENSCVLPGSAWSSANVKLSIGSTTTIHGAIRGADRGGQKALQQQHPRPDPAEAHDPHKRRQQQTVYAIPLGMPPRHSDLRTHLSDSSVVSGSRLKALVSFPVWSLARRNGRLQVGHLHFGFHGQLI